MSRSRNWIFTLNNYTDADVEQLRELGGGGRCLYLVFGRERGVGGTPHLQGYVRYPHAKLFSAVKHDVSERAHVQPARGTFAQASAYCKKELDFEEFGEGEPEQGRRTDLDRFREWITTLSDRPATADIVRLFPALWIRSGTRLWDVVDAFLPPVRRIQGTPVLRTWQSELLDIIEADEPTDRTVMFYVDPAGNTGKSWFCRFLLDIRLDVQVLRIGKRDDLAHAIDTTKHVFLVDVPRSQMEFLQYSVLEMLKDQTIFSPKYHSMTKTLSRAPFVVVFCNEEPDMTKLSEDRYLITYV